MRAVNKGTVNSVDCGRLRAAATINQASMPGTLRIAVLASGRGSNLQALLMARERGTLAAEVVLVASDKADALALLNSWLRVLKDLAISVGQTLISPALNDT